MPIKRKLDLDEGDDAGGNGGAYTDCTPHKTTNRGQTVDAASKTQMLLKFGQVLQAQKSRAAKQAPEPVSDDVLCSRCPIAGKQAAVGRCNYCSRVLCVGCQNQCCCCGQNFCSMCSTLDYAEYETRAVCLDCSR
ncbi:hypothetical protein GGI09_003067 [Coemansia sp. S100]|nr:hypothetical protein GGI09_003067 [Coemansia sp. S100]